VPGDIAYRSLEAAELAFADVEARVAQADGGADRARGPEGLAIRNAGGGELDGDHFAYIAHIAQSRHDRPFQAGNRDIIALAVDNAASSSRPCVLTMKAAIPAALSS
jgi:hypothetical protein